MYFWHAIFLTWIYFWHAYVFLISIYLCHAYISNMHIFQTWIYFRLAYIMYNTCIEMHKICIYFWHACDYYMHIFLKMHEYANYTWINLNFVTNEQPHCTSWTYYIHFEFWFYISYLRMNKNIIKNWFNSFKHLFCRMRVYNSNIPKADYSVDWSKLVGIIYYKNCFWFFFVESNKEEAIH